VKRVVLAAAVLILVAAPTASSADPPASGWWWARASDGIAVPPPWVPADGLYIAANPVDDEGVEAVAAARWSLPAGTTAVSLTVDVASSQGDVAVGACPVTGPWTAAQGGSLEQRPPADCDRMVTGVLGADGSTVTFAVAGLETAGVLDVALVPITDGTATFHLALGHPDESSLATTPAAAGPTTTTTTTTGAAPGAPAPATPPRATTVVVTAPTIPTTVAATPATATPLHAAADTVVAAAPATSEVAGRWLALLLGALVLGAAVAALRRRDPAITGFGPSARPRDGRAPSLR
jgi:hypothetical protein